MGAANRKVMDSPTLSPFSISPRAMGTLPHSQTGISIPSSDSTIRRRTGRAGSQRNRTSGGNQTCTKIETRIPRNTKGSDSITTLMDSVKKSWTAPSIPAVAHGTSVREKNTTTATRQSTSTKESRRYTVSERRALSIACRSVSGADSTGDGALSGPGCPMQRG